MKISCFLWLALLLIYLINIVKTYCVNGRKFISNDNHLYPNTDEEYELDDDDDNFRRSERDIDVYESEDNENYDIPSINLFSWWSSKNKDKIPNNLLNDTGVSSVLNILNNSYFDKENATRIMTKEVQVTPSFSLYGTTTKEWHLFRKRPTTPARAHTFLSESKFFMPAFRKATTFSSLLSTITKSEDMSPSNVTINVIINERNDVSGQDKACETNVVTKQESNHDKIYFANDSLNSIQITCDRNVRTNQTSIALNKLSDFKASYGNNLINNENKQKQPNNARKMFDNYVEYDKMYPINYTTTEFCNEVNGPNNTSVTNYSTNIVNNPENKQNEIETNHSTNIVNPENKQNEMYLPHNTTPYGNNNHGQLSQINFTSHNQKINTNESNNKLNNENKQNQTNNSTNTFDLNYVDYDKMFMLNYSTTTFSTEVSNQSKPNEANYSTNYINNQENRPNELYQSNNSQDINNFNFGKQNRHNFPGHNKLNVHNKTIKTQYNYIPNVDQNQIIYHGINSTSSRPDQETNRIEFINDDYGKKNGNKFQESRPPNLLPNNSSTVCIATEMNASSKPKFEICTTKYYPLQSTIHQELSRPSELNLSHFFNQNISNDKPMIIVNKNDNADIFPLSVKSEQNSSNFPFHTTKRSLIKGFSKRFLHLYKRTTIPFPSYTTHNIITPVPLPPVNSAFNEIPLNSNVLAKTGEKAVPPRLKPNVTINISRVSAKHNKEGNIKNSRQPIVATVNNTAENVTKMNYKDISNINQTDGNHTNLRYIIPEYFSGLNDELITHESLRRKRTSKNTQLASKSNFSGSKPPKAEIMSDIFVTRFKNLQNDLNELQKAIIASVSIGTTTEIPKLTDDKKNMTVHIRVIVDVFNSTEANFPIEDNQIPTTINSDVKRAYRTSNHNMQKRNCIIEFKSEEQPKHTQQMVDRDKSDVGALIQSIMEQKKSHTHKNENNQFEVNLNFPQRKLKGDRLTLNVNKLLREIDASAKDIDNKSIYSKYITGQKYLVIPLNYLEERRSKNYDILQPESIYFKTLNNNSNDQLSDSIAKFLRTTYSPIKSPNIFALDKNCQRNNLVNYASSSSKPTNLMNVEVGNAKELIGEPEMGYEFIYGPNNEENKNYQTKYRTPKVIEQILKDNKSRGKEMCFQYPIYNFTNFDDLYRNKSESKVMSFEYPIYNITNPNDDQTSNPFLFFTLTTNQATLESPDIYALNENSLQNKLINQSRISSNPTKPMNDKVEQAKILTGEQEMEDEYSYEPYNGENTINSQTKSGTNTVIDENQILDNCMSSVMSPDYPVYNFTPNDNLCKRDEDKDVQHFLYFTLSNTEDATEFSIVSTPYSKSNILPLIACKNRFDFSFHKKSNMSENLKTCKVDLNRNEEFDKKGYLDKLHYEGNVPSSDVQTSVLFSSKLNKKRDTISLKSSIKKNSNHFERFPNNNFPLKYTKNKKPSEEIRYKQGKDLATHIENNSLRRKKMRHSRKNDITQNRIKKFTELNEFPDEDLFRKNNTYVFYLKIAASYPPDNFSSTSDSPLFYFIDKGNGSVKTSEMPTKSLVSLTSSTANMTNNKLPKTTSKPKTTFKPVNTSQFNSSDDDECDDVDFIYTGVPPPESTSSKITSITTEKKPFSSKTGSTKSLTSGTPTVSRSLTSETPTVSKSLTGETPTVSKSLTGETPTVSKSLTGETPAVSKSLTGETPAVSKSLLTGEIPTVSKSITSETPTVSKSLTGETPTVSSKSLTGETPTVSKSLTSETPTVSKSLTGETPTVSKSLTGETPTVSKSLTGETPTVSKSLTGETPTVSKSLTGVTPIISNSLTSETPVDNDCITDSEIKSTTITTPLSANSIKEYISIRLITYSVYSPSYTTTETSSEEEPTSIKITSSTLSTPLTTDTSSEETIKTSSEKESNSMSEITDSIFIMPLTTETLEEETSKTPISTKKPLFKLSWTTPHLLPVLRAKADSKRILNKALTKCEPECDDDTNTNQTTPKPHCVRPPKPKGVQCNHHIKNHTTLQHHRKNRTDHHKMNNTDHKMNNTDHKMNNTDHQMNNTDHKMNNTDHKMNNTDHQMNNTHHQMTNTEHPIVNPTKSVHLFQKEKKVFHLKGYRRKAKSKKPN